MYFFPSPRQRGKTKSLVMRFPWQLFALESGRERRLREGGQLLGEEMEGKFSFKTRGIIYLASFWASEGRSLLGAGWRLVWVGCPASQVSSQPV